MSSTVEESCHQSDPAKQDLEGQSRSSADSSWRSFTESPGKNDLLCEAGVHYMEAILDLLVAVLAAFQGKVVLCIVNLFCVLVPGIVQAVNVYLVLGIVKKDWTAAQKLGEAKYCAFQVSRLRTAYNYYKGEHPIWSLLFKEKLGSLVVACLPAFCANIMALLEGGIDGSFMKRVAILATVWQSINACWSVTAVHSCHGPPGNMQRYRYWDIDNSPRFHILVMLLIDFSQVYYRLMMFTFVTAFVGIEYALFMGFSMALVTALFVRLGFRYINAYRGKVALMSMITGIECALYDYCWLEPVPVYSFYIEASFFLRALQAAVAAWLIHAHWDIHKEWDGTIFNIYFGSGVIAFFFYFFVYPYYVFHLSVERVKESRQKRDEVIGGEMKGKSAKRLTQRDAQHLQVQTVDSSHQTNHDRVCPDSKDSLQTTKDQLQEASSSAFPEEPRCGKLSNEQVHVQVQIPVLPENHKGQDPRADPCAIVKGRREVMCLGEHYIIKFGIKTAEVEAGNAESGVQNARTKQERYL